MTTLRSGGGAEAQTADLAGLFNYPSLGRLLEGGDPRALEEMRARLARTNQELERVVRQGTREDADRAARAARAVTLTLALLDTLDGMRREGAPR
ncbi:MAG: hypothetical protein JOZ02_20420 [Acidobacteria bacterium]|nr:hypothetical protein [Acidobacteriota bacterium]